MPDSRYAELVEDISFRAGCLQDQEITAVEAYEHLLKIEADCIEVRRLMNG